MIDPEIASRVRRVYGSACERVKVLEELQNNLSLPQEAEAYENASVDVTDFIEQTEARAIDLTNQVLRLVHHTREADEDADVMSDYAGLFGEAPFVIGEVTAASAIATVHEFTRYASGAIALTAATKRN